MNVRKIGLVLAGVAALACTPASAANLVINGAFEGGTFDGVPSFWSRNPGNEVAVAAGGDYAACCNVTGTATELANHFAVFGGGDQPNISTLSQIIDTVSGAVYQLSFDFGVVGRPGTPQTIFATVFEADGGALIGSTSATQFVDNVLSTTFRHYTFSFTAASSITRIAFNFDTPSLDADGILDNVVTESAVPEPATWAMLLGGFGLIGSTLRRRRALRPVLA